MKTTNVDVITTFTSQKQYCFRCVGMLTVIEKILVFKRIPKERQSKEKLFYKIVSHGIEFIKNDVNLKLRLN